MENTSYANLQQRREFVLNQCKSKINWWINRLVLIEAFVNGDIIFVAAVTKWVIYKTHLFAIQYTKIEPASNVYAEMCAGFSNFSQNGEKFYKTDLIKLVSETILREFDALKKFQEIQVNTPNPEESFKDVYLKMREKESEIGIGETLSRLNESNPRHYVVKANKGFPPDIIRQGNQSIWTEFDLKQQLLDLCGANGIAASSINNLLISKYISLKVPIDNKTLEISHQKLVCIHLWEATFIFIIKEHFYSEGYHIEEKQRTVIKTKFDSNGNRSEYEEEVIDIYKHEEVYYDHIFMGEIYLAETETSVYKAANLHTE